MLDALPISDPVPDAERDGIAQFPPLYLQASLPAEAELRSWQLGEIVSAAPMRHGWDHSHCVYSKNTERRGILG
jgi:hypothetical protein